jgi:hypothetical protein
LSGEEAFWQLFLHDHRSGLFFSNETKVGANWGEGSAMTRNADEIPDQRHPYARSIEDLRRDARQHRAAEAAATQFQLGQPGLDELRPVAEEIWQLAYNERLTLAELHGRTRFCDWKVYQAAYQMVRNGLFTLDSKKDEPLLVGG